MFMKRVSAVLFLIMMLSTSALAAVDSVFMGTYDLLNDSAAGPVPIEWYVIETSDDSYMFLSRYAVAQRRINETPETYWGKTELSRWLNNEFFNEAFSDQEKEMIIEQNDGYVSLLRENDDISNIKAIQNNPEIMILEQTTDFQEKKWWSNLYPNIWLGLGDDKTKIRPAYDAKCFGDLYGGGMGYYEAATYYAIEEDHGAPNGYSVLNYGYPLNEPLAVRPVIVVDRDYALQLMGIVPPNPQSSDAIIVDGLIEAMSNPGPNIFETLKPVFGDLTSIPHSYTKSGEDKEIKESVLFSFTDGFAWGNHWVSSFSIRASKYNEYFEGEVIQRIFISVVDSSPENEYTGSEIFSNTTEYYNSNSNWEYVYNLFPYREQAHGAGMELDRVTGINDTDAWISIALSVATADYDFDTFYSEPVLQN